MKDKEHSLLYHTMHSRPMPGCLPLFFLLSMVVVGVGIWFVPVEMPKRIRPAGVGRVYLRNDRLTDFVLRRTSPLPLQLPLHADPEHREDMAAASMPLLRPVSILPPPPMPVFDEAPDSAVLDAAELLRFPDAEAQAEPAAPAPGVEQGDDGEEVQP